MVAEGGKAYGPIELPALPGKPGAAFKTLAYPGHLGAERVLLESCDLFQVSRFHLARLLGLPWPGHIYTWLNGSKRPSALYLTRLCRLHLLYSTGVPLMRYRAVDWDLGELVAYDSPLPKRPTVQGAAARLRQPTLGDLDAVDGLGPIRGGANGEEPVNWGGHARFRPEAQKGRS